ncbi:MAG: GH3 auxin-responsive promoter family protein [Bacteroidales bacterium]
MALINSMLLWLMKERLQEIEFFENHPQEVQNNQLKALLKSAQNTEYGKMYDFSHILHAEEFRERLPINTYESIKPYVDRLRTGEQNLLWSSEIKWFAKSSGTTSSKSKFIPVSNESLEECHYKGGKDLYTLYVNAHPESEIFWGKNMAMGGSHHICENNSEAFYGDVSAIIMQNLPFWAEFKRVPNIEIALMDEWESKIDKMAQATLSENITNIAGVPSWILVFLRKILEVSGKETIREVWPNLEAFFHGGVSFTPYKSQFEKIMGRSNFNYVETYNASEGFFGIQDIAGAQDMLLMLDYGIYYEFIPLEELHQDHPKCLEIGQVEAGKNYALVISTNAGLWRYLIGDTVQFTSIKPYRIRVSGRTKNFINAFGEEIIVENADRALSYACEQTRAEISDYTAGPIFLDEKNQACHQWLIEFKQFPSDIENFTTCLDVCLKQINSDYEAKRYCDMVLKRPQIVSLPQGSFYQWMKSKDKLGGQHKVPRLANDRQYLDDILSQMKK